ncbi:MAG: ribosome maturation factor RimM [Corynebacterium sp.]|nr:ribosome maturation factor RimM [Corynebacterium sp.]
MNDEVMIGRVVKPHGIRGELAVESTTDTPEERFYIGAVLRGRQTGKEREITIKTLRVHKGRFLLTFEEIPDRTAAESLRGMKFWAEPIYEEDGFYDHELEGLEVRENDEVIGIVEGVMHLPAGEILQVALDSDKEVLIPFREEIVPEVNVEEGWVLITPPEGLLDL